MRKRTNVYRDFVEVRRKNMVVSPEGLGTKNYYAGEDQQQFTRPKNAEGVMS
jgi:hypothetical protein